VTDTLGRVALASSGFGHSGNTVTVAGLAVPYTLTWGSASSNFSVQYHELDGDTQCRGLSSEQGNQPVITAVQLPDGTSYRLEYTDTVSGLLTKVVYPNGGYLVQRQDQASATNLTTYSYFARVQPKEQDNYDFGNTTTPLKKTIWKYQTFPGTPIYPNYVSIVDRPCNVVVEDGSSTSYAETDYLYDGEETVCGTAGTPSTAAASVPTGTHDETNYGANVTTARGNATSVTRKCLHGCTASTTKSNYRPGYCRQ
jgi:hypothetical protein